MTTPTPDISLSAALVAFHSEDLLGLITGLTLELEGRLVPGTDSHDELIDEELATEVAEALEIWHIDLLIGAVQDALEERHWEIAEVMTEYRAGCGWHATWLEAVFAAASRFYANAELALAA